MSETSVGESYTVGWQLVCTGIDTAGAGGQTSLERKNEV